MRWPLRVFLQLGFSLVLLTWPAALAQQVTTPRKSTAGPVTTFPPTFFVRNYGGKCLDFGAPPQVSGSPVFIFECNGTIAQQIEIQEINERHDVILRAGNKVIGARMEHVVGPIESGASFEEEILIELQDEKDRDTVFSRGQIFSLDGDSIILAANRASVIKVQNARGADRTPLVLGRRDLADAEFWTFTATDGSAKRPTSGFVRVSVPDANKFANDLESAKPGTVFELDPDLALDLTDRYIRIPSQVTIRGDRRGLRLGPEIHSKRVAGNTMLEIAGSDVRITGLRVRGPSRSTDGTPDVRGILFNSEQLLFHGSIIDHNDMSEWTLAAVDVRGTDIATYCQAGDDIVGSTQHNVRVVRNFIHHNQKQGEGYGVVTKMGGNSLIEGNTFVSNRHAIAGGGQARTVYRARHNLVLEAAPKQKRGWGIIRWHTHDFDMHGTGNPWYYPAGFSGIGGQYIQIARNTFLGRNRNNFKLRGEPCYLAEFHHNISLQEREDAVSCDQCGNEDKLSHPAHLNHFESINPTTKLGVGDFDGDGADDLFLATGMGWYYAPQGIAAWRFINSHSDGIANLLFGDFDGDRRTDVFTQRGRDWLVSWGGASQWEKINSSDPSLKLSEFRIGDFIGDRRADVFYADGQRWWVSDGGVGPFTNTQNSGYRAASLGFGDFNGDGKMDVVGVSGGKWAVSLNAKGAWEDFPLRPALTSSMAGMIIADFNGNGLGDIASPLATKISYDGRGDWVSLPSHPGTLSAVGRFDSTPGADTLFFRLLNNYLVIRSSGVGTYQRHSSQDMR
jgi:hypothetical protein